METGITSGQNQPKTTRNPVLAAAIPAAIAAVGSIIGTHQQAKANKAATDAQNLYNSPAEQMKRYKAAGLNTALLYGQVESGNQSAPTEQPDYTAPFHKGIETALAASAQRLELKRIQNDTQRVDMEKKLNDVNVALVGTEIANNKKNLEVIAKTAIKLDEETNAIRQQISQNSQRFEKELANLDKDLILKDWQISCSWMDFEQKKFTFEKLMPLQEKFLSGQASYEQVVGELAHELVNADIFSKKKADLESWLVGAFGDDFKNLIHDIIEHLNPKGKKSFWEWSKDAVKEVVDRAKKEGKKNFNPRYIMKKQFGITFPHHRTGTGGGR